jgi:hypothetical protein
VLFGVTIQKELIKLLLIRSFEVVIWTGDTAIFFAVFKFRLILVSILPTGIPQVA